MLIRIIGLALMLAPLGRAGLPRVLFLTHSAGFVHDVVKRKAPDRLSLAEEQLVAAAKGKFEIVATQDCGEITAERLQGYAAVAFYTTGELPIDADALVAFVKSGGGFIGIHCATDTLYKHAGYSEMIAGNFDGHPWHKKVRIKVEDRRHPATNHLPASFEIVDEIYQFKNWDRKNVHVLLSLDPSSVDVAKGKREDKDYANAWTRTFGKGRVFYTALGHGANAWKDPRFLEHVLNGVSWAIGAKEPVDEEGFEPLAPESKREFKNFILRLEFRQPKPGACGGVLVRGVEVAIGDDKPSKTSTGAIAGVQAPESAPVRPGWNEFEVMGVGKKLYVRLNGILINTFTGNGGTAGSIGWREEGVEFRSMRVRELSAQAEGCGEAIDREIEDATLLLEWKGKLEASVKGVPIVRESADWSRLAVETVGKRVRVFVNGVLEDDTAGENERGRIELRGEHRNPRLIDLHREW